MGAFATLHFGMAYGTARSRSPSPAAATARIPRSTSQFQAGLEEQTPSVIRSQGHGALRRHLRRTAPQRVQLENKDPRGFAEYLRQFKEHSALGAANTLLGVQCRRPSFYDLTAEMARMDGADAHHVGRRGGALPRGEPADEAHHPDARRSPSCRAAGTRINLEEPALFNQLLEDFLHQVEAGRWRPRDPRSTVPSIYGPAGKP